MKFIYSVRVYLPERNKWEIWGVVASSEDEAAHLCQSFLDERVVVHCAWVER